MKHMLWLVIALLLGGTMAVAADDHHPEPPAIDDPRFEFLRSLEGQWISQPGQDEMSGGRFEFRLTAGGTAIQELEMVGTPMEMMTVYHMDGSALVGTHYCMLGNQPHVTAASEIVDRTLSFSCDGKPGNTASHDAHHVHAWAMQLQDDGTLLYTAEMADGGQITDGPTLVLVRQSNTASR